MIDHNDGVIVRLIGIFLILPVHNVRTKTMQALSMILLFMITVQQLVLAADKPVWMVETRELGIPTEMLVTKLKPIKRRDSAVTMEMSSADEIIVNFIKYRTEGKWLPQKIQGSFVTLLISLENGKLLNRHEWPEREDPNYRSLRLKPLALGGYVVIFNNHLQVLDLSLNVLHDRTLERLPEHWVYDLITPLSGHFFVLVRESNLFLEEVEVIDSRTFKAVDQWEVPRIGVLDILEDHIVGIRARQQKGYDLIEKRIGNPWRDLLVLELEGNGYDKAQFTSTGAIALASWLKQNEGFPCWYVLDGGNKSAPVIYSHDESINSLIPRSAGLHHGDRNLKMGWD